MRKLVLSMQMSLNGFAEGPKKDMSWMQPDTEEQWNNLFAMLKNVDLFVMGRGMWKEYRDYWTRALDQPGFSSSEVKYATLATQTPHIVFSKTLQQSGWPNATIARGDLKRTITQLKQQPGKNIQIVGGAKFAAALIDTGLVDEYRLCINPVIVAKGKSIFSKLLNRHNLQLKAITALTPGLVLLHYIQLDTVDAEKVKSKKRRGEH